MEKVVKKKWGECSKEEQTQAIRQTRYQNKYNASVTSWLATNDEEDVVIYDWDVKTTLDRGKTISTVIMGGIKKKSQDWSEENDSYYVMPIMWDEKTGNALHGYTILDDLYVYQNIIDNYDHITEKDIPETEEFKKKYEDYCKYSNKMSPVEYMRYKAFAADHKQCRADNGAIGGGLIVSFMGTGIGNCVKCECGNCGAKVDITDSESW